MVGRSSALALVLGLVAGLALSTPPSAGAGTQVHSGVVSDNPANWTPHVLDGSVKAIIQVGDTMIVGGLFNQIQGSEDTDPVITRPNIFAFDATTGVINNAFTPAVDGEVSALAASADGLSVFLGGDFNTVNGTGSRKVAKLSVATGARVTAFKPGAVSSKVNDLKLSRGRLVIGGQFSTIKQVSRPRLASLDPTTGALTDDINVSITGTHNGGTTAIVKFAVDPAGNRLVLIGNFTTVGGLARRQVAMLDISGASATVADWATTLYTSTCASAFDTYLRDVDISPDGSYVVISTTGAYRGSESGCDVIARFEMGATGADVRPTWRDYTGGDTTYAVEITGTVVYVGGHFRWLNNAFAADTAGPGAIPREGVAALDPANGLPFSWSPGRERGVGVFDMLATPAGLWIGHDTDRVANELRPRVSFFPLAAGTTPPPNQTGALPTDVYLLGGGIDPTVLYRVNAGGPELTTADDGPNWAGDTSASPSPFHNAGSSVSTVTSNTSIDATVPNTTTDRVPIALFNTTRTDPSALPDMQWSFPVAAGTPLTARLYFAHRSTGTRTLSVRIDGITKTPSISPTSTGTMRSYDVVSDGTLNVDFLRVTNDPLVNGLEILVRGAIPTSATGTGDVRTQGFDGSATTGPLTTTAGTEPWGQARGAFVVDSTLYTGFANGTLTARSFDGVTYGTPSTLSLSGGGFGTELRNVTGMFFDGGRIYFTLANDSNLYYRYFTPQSGVVGSVRYAVPTSASLTSMAPQRVAGMFRSGSTVYFADRTTGGLQAIGFSGGVLSGTAAAVNNALDWRARGLFVRSGLLPNSPPTAVAVATGCVLDVCSFDGTGSTDTDGSILSYAWEFGDGGTSTESAPTHSYAAGGDYTATLTVTDDRGDSRSDTVDLTAGSPVNVAPTAAFTSSCVNLSCTFDGTGSSDSDGTVQGYSWDFGDGQTDSVSGTTTTHAYSSEGPRTVSLVVADDDGADSAPVEHSVTPTAPPASAVAFRAAATSSASTTTHRVTVPSAVQADDAMLLFVTTNTVNAVTAAPSGWDLEGSRQSSTDTRTLLYSRVATASDASTSASVTFAATTKGDLTLLAYSGTDTDPVETVASAGETANRPAHTAPGVTVPTAGSRVVSYWADKSSATTGWTLPAGQVQRSTSIGSGAGRITSVASDTGESSPAGPSAGITATASSSSAKATMWSVVLKDVNAPNKPPVAGFTTSCTYLSCTVDGVTSSDPDGTVATYAWDFAGEGSDSGATATHTFAGAGTHPISLVVTDNEGMPSAVVTHEVTVSAPPDIAFRAANTFVGNNTILRVRVPDAVDAGDELLLFVTQNNLAEVTAPAGWTLVGAQQSSTDIRTVLYERLAGSADAGVNVPVTFAATTKATLTLLAYSGTSATSPIAAWSSAGETTVRSTHVTPTAAVDDGRCWVVSYWADKSSATTAWVVPAEQTVRSAVAGSGPGRVTSVATDWGTTAPVGPAGALEATADSSSGKATMWSVVLRAAA